MPLVHPRLWPRKVVWDYLDWGFTTCAAISGGATALVGDGNRAIPGCLAAGFAVAAGFAKFRSKRCDDREKAAKAAAEVAAANARDVELESLRLRYSQQAQRMVKAALLHMHEHFFEREPNQDRHKHRVTLFVSNTGAGPGSCARWLAIYAREGAHPDSACTWPLDDNDPERCRGIAGKVWAYKTTEFAAADCDWPEADDVVLKARYAQSLGITVDEAESLRIKSRVFAGALVMVRGEPWGVLLVDSRKDWRSPNPGQLGRQRKRLERYATLIGRILAEAGS